MSTKARRIQWASAVAVVVLASGFALSVLGRDDERRERTVATGATVRRSDPAGRVHGRVVAPIARPARVGLAPAGGSPEEDHTDLAPPTASLSDPSRAVGGAGPSPSAVDRSGDHASNDEGSDVTTGEDAEDDGLATPRTTPPRHVVYVARGALLGLVARGLASASADDRIDAIRVVRANGIVEAEPRVATLALEDRDAEVRRYASQALALGAPEKHRAVLERLATDQDLGVRANAAFGLSRLGDAAAQARLVSVYEEAHRSGSRFVKAIEETLACKDLDGSAVVAAHRKHKAED